MFPEQAPLGGHLPRVQGSQGAELGLGVQQAAGADIPTSMGRWKAT